MLMDGRMTSKIRVEENIYTIKMNTVEEALFKVST